MIIGLVLIPICRCITEVSDYAMYVYFYVISLSASQLFLCDLRGKELLLKYSLGNILQTLMIAILNITFLLVFKMETGGYLLAYIIANFIVAIYAIIAGKGYKAFSFHNIDRCKLKEMIRYSVVLIPNTFMWWIMNSSDRVMVTYMIGAAANGIYAVSYKLPTLVSTLTGIFNQAWSYSAIREEGTRDETEYNNKMFKTLSAIAFMMGIGLLLLTKPFLRVYVADSYYDAWKYTPFLIVGCVYLTLGTFMATSYTVHKDSFVDGDDWVDANYVTYFVDLLEKSSCDVVMNKNNYSGCNDISNNNFSVISAEKAIEWIYLGDLFVAVWNKMYRRSVLEENYIKFNEKIWYGEGMLFNVEFLQHVNSVAVGESAVYHQTFNPDSAMRKFNLKSNLCGIKSLELQKEAWIKKNIDIEKAWEYHRYCFNRSIIDGLVRSNMILEYKETYKECVSNLRKNIFLPLKMEKSIKKKIMWCCYFISPRLMAIRKAIGFKKAAKIGGV